MFSPKWALVVALIAVGLVLPATLVARQDATPRQTPTAHVTSRASVRHARRVRRCGGRLFTVKMAMRASHAAFSGTRRVTRHDWRVLFYFVRCQRNLVARKFVHRVYRADGSAHAQRVTDKRNGCTFSYGCWSINPRIVYCESGYVNLSPNSASASGYYQITRDTWIGWGGGRYAPEAYEATRYEQSVIAWHGSKHDTDYSPWSASQGCWG